MYEGFPYRAPLVLSRRFPRLSLPYRAISHRHQKGRGPTKKEQEKNGSARRLLPAFFRPSSGLFLFWATGNCLLKRPETCLTSSTPAAAGKAQENFAFFLSARKTRFSLRLLLLLLFLSSSSSFIISSVYSYLLLLLLLLFQQHAVCSLFLLLGSVACLLALAAAALVSSRLSLLLIASIYPSKQDLSRCYLSSWWVHHSSNNNINNIN
ncbi:uncharacterized protein ARB_07767 [Trichophyton benhamiae CBS 112371]|uniref:Transmembrane protein n=1 Tax=Arthroderma benhamiae (strain ATCC MYA-4681 / CBS 112371) TaxID=663331 RepID=D4ATV4_ARTBC|nr:uncharacterized protein ARB_07767 [Trichophyton benhamiae CBS 112371]EFE33407.1 hypothetical protein ARB_07767 [Trichophyton benhamiae CBS 112371]